MFPIRTMTRNDVEFPPSLLTSADPPKVLYVRGTLKNVPAISVVGTRRATSYGLQAVTAIVPALVDAGLAIVSGLALGIDAASHEACLQRNGYTIAVLGTGNDDPSIYPRANFQLAQRILEMGGAIITEHPPGTLSHKGCFPKRNRIIAGISLATLVIEASERSGSLITAKLALEENREVLAVPGPIWSSQSKGTNALLKAGAGVCTEANDVLESLALERPQANRKALSSLPLDPHERELLQRLETPQHIDELARQSRKDAATISAELTLLELKGLIARLDGQMWIAS